MVARINAPAGTVVYFGSGFMPSASSYSARAVVGADGGLIGIPAGVTSAYLLVEPRPWILGDGANPRRAVVTGANFDAVNPVGETDRGGRCAAIVLEEDPEGRI